VNPLPDCFPVKGRAGISGPAFHDPESRAKETCPMEVRLEAIKFNHQATSATNDGFSIRHNETRALRSPEWQSSLTGNSEDSPAAYALTEIKNQTLSIQARITWSDVGVNRLWIRTVDGNIYPERTDIGRFLQFAFWLFRSVVRRAVVPNVLGVVEATEIKQTDDFKMLCLKDVRLHEAGIGVFEVIWRWQFSTDGNRWTDFEKTKHRIYSVLKLPTGAWQPNSDNPANTQLPWTGVLEYACRWAAGATCEREIANKITREVNNLGPTFVHYNDVSLGSPHYTPNDPPRFDCQRFLDLLNGASQNSADPNVNCDDCAAIVSSFVSVLGYALPVSAMKPVTPPKFFLRRHQKIGLGWEDIDSFFHHTVAWRGGDDDEVSDACIRLDANETGLGQPVPLLAGSLRFGRSGEHLYRHLLALNENCQYTDHSTRFRCIGLDSPDCQGLDTDIDLELIKRIYEHDKWREPRENQPLAERNLLIKRGQVFDGWQVTTARFVPVNSAEFIISRCDAPTENVLRIDVQFANDSADAAEALLRLLARFEKPGLKFRKESPVGDNAFADDPGFVILFSRINLIVLIRNLTQTPIALWTIARFIDALILEI